MPKWKHTYNRRHLCSVTNMCTVAAFILGSSLKSRGRSGAGHGTRTRAYNSSYLLSQSSMVQDVLQAAGVDSDMAFARDSRLHNCILGIVRLTPGTDYESSMTKFNSQERLLWQTLQYGG